ncbi:MAG TPA: hypothetical protein VN782_12245 [Usitatibacter sp.]|nr:hypothetical protein [Usitatibacter sp.]
MNADELARLRHLAGKHRGRVRHDPAKIVRVQTLLLFPQIGQAAISEMTGVSVATIKRIKAGILHRKVKACAMEARQIAAELGLPMPQL